MSHPFNGSETVEFGGLTFQRDGDDAYRCGGWFEGVNILLGSGFAPQATDYRHEIRTGPCTVTFPQFDLGTPDGLDAFKRHLIEASV